MNAEELAERLNGCGMEASACPDIKTACESAEASGKLTVICGSLYLYKDYVLEVRDVHKQTKD
jgi:folylpolyglutamate synthase/dihydropteroate synthase